MNRRGFLQALGFGAAGFIAVPKFGSIVPAARFRTLTDDELTAAMRTIFSDPVARNMVGESPFPLLDGPWIVGGRYVETAQYFTLPQGVGVRASGPYIPVDVPTFRDVKMKLRKVLIGLEESHRRLGLPSPDAVLRGVMP